MTAHWIRAFILFVIAATCSFAQTPVVNSAVNAASFATEAEGPAKLARGGIFSIFGTGIGAPTGIQASAFPLPTELGGSSVEVTVNGTTRSAIILYSVASQINAILPSDLPSGTGTLIVKYGGQSSVPLTVAVVDHFFGAFTIGSAGVGNAIATDAVSGRLNLATGTAQEGGYWDIWGTGLGPIQSADNEVPPLVDQTNVDVQVIVGGKPAQVVFRGRSPCCAGLDQIRFIVPAGVEGCCVPVEVKVNGTTANSIGMSFSPDSRICSQERFSEVFGNNQIADLIAKGKFSYGQFMAQRFVGLTTPTAGLLSESFLGSMQETSPTFAGCGIGSDTTAPPTLPIGDCTTIRFDLSVSLNPDFTFATKMSWEWTAFDKNGGFLDDARYEFESSSTTPDPAAVPRLVEGLFAVTGVRSLDAGAALTLTAPGGGTTSVPKTALPTNSFFLYSWDVGQNFASGVPTGVWVPGTHKVSAPGGRDVSAFSFDLDGFEAVNLTNAADFGQPVPLDRPLRFNWSGGGPDIEQMVVVGSSGRTVTDSGTTTTGTSFACTVDSSLNTFSVPVSVLRKMVPSDLDTGSAGLESVSSKQLSIPGLDYSTAAWSNSNTINTKYVGTAAQ